MKQVEGPDLAFFRSYSLFGPLCLLSFFQVLFTSGQLSYLATGLPNSVLARPLLRKLLGLRQKSRFLQLARKRAAKAEQRLEKFCKHPFFQKMVHFMKKREVLIFDEKKKIPVWWVAG